MEAGRVTPLMFPGTGCARSSSSTSLRHPPNLHGSGGVICAGTSSTLAGSGRWGAQRSEIKADAEGRGTFAELSAPSA